MGEPGEHPEGGVSSGVARLRPRSVGVVASSCASGRQPAGHRGGQFAGGFAGRRHRLVHETDGRPPSGGAVAGACSGEASMGSGERGGPLRGVGSGVERNGGDLHRDRARASFQVHLAEGVPPADVHAEKRRHRRFGGSRQTAGVVGLRQRIRSAAAGRVRAARRHSGHLFAVVRRTGPIGILGR